MSKPILYIFIGYPGAGKTTVAKIISQKTGAVHLMADQERHKMFGKPTHSAAESHQLYNALNDLAADLLSQGRSVVFDTNFNFRADRDKLCSIAESNGADMRIIWVTVDIDTAKKRAVHSEYIRNGYSASMSEAHFDEIVSKLEPPSEDEIIIKIDGTKLDPGEVLALIK